MEVLGTMAISLMPGMYADINIPTTLDTDTMPNGMLPRTEPYPYKGVDRTLVRGFFVENENVGELSALAEDSNIALKPRVRYTHNKPFPNRIYFVDVFGNFAIIDIAAIPIHDHSSVATGGPAYGTYYSNYSKQNIPEG